MREKILGIIVLCITLSQQCIASQFIIEPAARVRIQQVDDPTRGNATANTAKLRLNGQWRISERLHTFFQGDYVDAHNEHRYNSVTVTRAASKIPETLGGEVNQAYIKYLSQGGWSAMLGRQSINFDKERHVSGVEFWQNDQTFDAFTLQYNDATHWTISYAYINRAHRIFGDSAKRELPSDDIRFNTGIDRPAGELGNHDHNTHLLNIKRTINRYVSVNAYAYLIDNTTAIALSSDTLGFSIMGEIKPNAIKYGYTIELAHQHSTHDNTLNRHYDGYYALLELSAQFKQHKFSVTHERLNENDGFAFATSLGNNHKFLGWADAFTGYAAKDGIRDTYLTYRGRKAKLRWRAVAHEFKSDRTGDTAGYELDMELGYRFNLDWQATVIVAKYFSDSGIVGLAATQSDLATISVALSYNL